MLALGSSVCFRCVCLFHKREKSNGEKMPQEVKPEKGMGGKETTADETAR